LDFETLTNYANKKCKKLKNNAYFSYSVHGFTHLLAGGALVAAEQELDDGRVARHRRRQQRRHVVRVGGHGGAVAEQQLHDFQAAAFGAVVQRRVALHALAVQVRALENKKKFNPYCCDAQSYLLFALKMTCFIIYAKCKKNNRKFLTEIFRSKHFWM